jgi:hypothetical protein
MEGTTNKTQLLPLLLLLVRGRRPRTPPSLDSRLSPSSTSAWTMSRCPPAAAQPRGVLRACNPHHHRLSCQWAAKGTAATAMLCFSRQTVCDPLKVLGVCSQGLVFLEIWAGTMAPSNAGRRASSARQQAGGRDRTNPMRRRGGAGVPRRSKRKPACCEVAGELGHSARRASAGIVARWASSSST